MSTAPPQATRPTALCGYGSQWPTPPAPPAQATRPTALCGYGSWWRVLAYRDTGGGARADTVHFGEGPRQAEALALAQAAARGLFVGLSHVPGLLLLVSSVQLVQGLFHLLHDRLVIVLQAWEGSAASGDKEDSGEHETPTVTHWNKHFPQARHWTRGCRQACGQDRGLPSQDSGRQGNSHGTSNYSNIW